MVSPAKRLGAMLCIALALVFGGTVAANAVDQVRHVGAFVAAHEHSPFSQPMADEHDPDHHADHHADDSQDSSLDGGADQPGHHHHGDGGSGIPALASVKFGGSPAGEARRPLPPDRSPARSASYGPERPPRTLGIQV